ncbi:hypothetical protein RRG08_051609 [Elysia crispata]|uniref:Uncharacterized protein n=1 Tax=Elysia crispata TaxID=231223 RepID=A0AAE1A447_9GAST|nr:hypothetical protein RRG08_051609 [Elysia crispata]
MWAWIQHKQPEDQFMMPNASPTAKYSYRYRKYEAKVDATFPNTRAAVTSSAGISLSIYKSHSVSLSPAPRDSEAGDGRRETTKPGDLWKRPHQFHDRGSGIHSTSRSPTSPATISSPVASSDLFVFCSRQGLMPCGLDKLVADIHNAR